MWGRFRTPNTRGAMKVHPVADAFPMMSEDEFSSLCADIREHGLIEPIVVRNGVLLDGRNRLKACKAIGVQPETVDWNPSGDISPGEWIISQNLKRRHLTSSQKAALALRIIPELEREAKERQGTRTDLQHGGKISTKSKSRERAAQTLGTNPRYVQDAKKIAEEAPDLIAEVESGESTIPQAKRKIKERKREARRNSNAEKARDVVGPLTDVGAQFATILIDPPWDWGDEGDVNQLGRAKPDYATMSIEDIAALPIPDVADVDCHLYLWITNRSLPKGFGLIDSWGFRYITALTWCKPHFGMGNYFRGQTEHILFAVRGSQPLKRKDVGTWFRADRGPGGHSSKPADAYDLIESVSPGPYLELFSRRERDGWTAWGADAT